MCFRFQQFDENKSDQEFEADLQRLLGLIQFPAEFTQDGNIALTDKALVVPNRIPLEGRLFRFGLLPHWEKANYSVQKTANARSETVDKLPSFRDAFRTKRVLIPVTGFYDWRLEPGDKKKTPYKAFLKSGEMFSLAGIYDGWKSPTGDVIYTFSIITCEPNELWSQIHNRMPVIMKKDGYETWLDPEVTDAEALKPLLQPYPAEEMTFTAYDQYLNKAGNKDKSLIKPMTNPSKNHPEQSTLF